MSNSISHAALPYPIKNARFSLAVGFETSAGVPTDPTSPDSEYSIDGGASFSDTTEEITTGGSNGVGYLTLTGAETNNTLLALALKSGNDVTKRMTLLPRVLATVGSGTLSAGSAGGGTLGTLLAYDVTGCFLRTTGGTGGGGTGGANNQARKIVTYNTSTGAFTVAPNWETTPDNTTTYDVLLPEGVTLGMLRSIAQTGDSYPIVSSGTHGNAALKTLIDTLTAYVDTEVAAIKSKTDNLPADPADASDIAAAFSTVNATLATVIGYIDTEIAAIKAKTDNLPADPADASDIAASFDSIASTLATLATYVDTEIAAIKSKTDNLPASPAATGDIPSAGTIADAVWDEDLTGHQTAGSAGKELSDAEGNASLLVTEVAKVPKSDGTETWNNTALASMQTKANDAIVANHLDHLLAMAYDPASKPGAADALLNELIDNDGGVSQFTANALENAPSGGGGGGGNVTVEEFTAGALNQIAAQGIRSRTVTRSASDIDVDVGGLHSEAAGTAWEFTDSAGIYPEGFEWWIEVRDGTATAVGTVEWVSGGPGEETLYRGEMVAAQSGLLNAQGGVGKFYVLQRLTEGGDPVLRWHGKANFIAAQRAS